MERFLPVLSTVQTRLREILTRTENCMVSWDMRDMKAVGEDLVTLAADTYPALVSVEHRILSLSFKEAGQGIKDRVQKIQSRELKEEDKEYFRSVHQALGNICEKIETGEYYQALLRMAAKSSLKRREYVT